MIYGETSPAYSILGVKQVTPRKDATPGPGEYTLTTDLLERPPKTVFGRAARAHLSRSMSPGPGSYAIPTKIGEGPKFQLRSRIDARLSRLSTPGPGAYDVKLTDSQLRYSFGGGMSRLTSRGTQGPGPGAYDPDSILKAAPKYK